MYKTTISSRHRLELEPDDSDQLPLFDHPTDVPVSAGLEDASPVKASDETPRLALVRTDETLEEDLPGDGDANLPPFMDRVGDEDEPEDIDESGSTAMLIVAEEDDFAEPPDLEHAALCSNVGIHDLGDVVAELESSLEDDLAVAEADLRALAAELEEEVNSPEAAASTPEVADRKPKEVVFDDDLPVEPMDAADVPAARAEPDPAVTVLEDCLTPIEPVLPAAAEDTVLISDEHLVEEEVELLDEESEGIHESERAEERVAASLPSITGRPMPDLPPRGEIAGLAAKGAAARPPKRIGDGRLVPTRLTWRPGEPRVSERLQARTTFRWDTMLTAACLTAVCGMGCIWLLRTLLA